MLPSANKAKTDPHGKLQNGESEMGDLQKGNDWEDAWSACASIKFKKGRKVKVHVM
jgi:hypothetical protein